MSGDVEVFADPGPPRPPAAAPGAGLRDEQCTAYRFERSGRVVLHDLDIWAGRLIEPDDHFVWNVFPAFDATQPDVRDGFRAASVAIDIVTEDGRRALDVVSSEVDGTPSAPATRTDVDFPDQWNERRVSLAALAGERIAAVEFVAALPAREGSAAATGWLDGIRIEKPSTLGASASPSERVPTTRGSNSSPLRSRGLTQPLTGVPHGGLFIAPATDLSNPHWTYSWSAHGPGPNPALAGLLVTRSPSIWIGDRSALALRIGITAVGDDDVAAEEFTHDDESAHPHRYRVRTLSGVVLDAVATDSASVVIAELPAPGRIVLTGLGPSDSSAGIVRAAAGSAWIEMSTVTPSPHEADPLRGYALVTVRGESVAARVSQGRAVVDVGAGTVRLDIGSSQLSLEQAARARDSVAGESLADLAEGARERWDDLLGRVDAPEAPDDERMLLASDLYRMSLYPTRHHESTPDGPRYPSPTERLAPDTDRRTGRAVREGRMLTNNGFWDTYRTVWPAYALLAPDAAARLLDGMLEHVRECGWSPRWTAGTPLDAMVGTSLDVISADLVQAGIEGIDLATAYESALRNATTPSVDARFGRKGMPGALARGFVDATTVESVSWTMEGAIADAGAAVLARAVARRAAGTAEGADARAEARYLAYRALAYRSLWDDRSQFFRPRWADGTWADERFDPRVWGGGHAETNAWGSRFAAPHDGSGMAALFGGPAALRRSLDAYFAEPETGAVEFAGSYGEAIHEMAEARDIRRGMWAMGNQPAHHVAWMYAHTDEPWRAGPLVTDAAHRLFRGTRIGQGYPGDEDNGEMSAWHLFATIGFAPFAPGSGTLLITPPRHDRLLLRPGGAPSLEIRTHRGGADDRFIREVRFNGRQWTSPTVGIAELHEGGCWDVDLTSAPVAWSDSLPERPFFAPDGVDRIALSDLVRRAPTVGHLSAGAVVHVEIDPVPHGDPPLLLLALETAGTHSFRIDAGDDSGGQVTHQRDAVWRWDGQARPFEVPLAPGSTRLTVRWESGPAVLTHVAVLAAT